MSDRITVTLDNVLCECGHDLEEAAKSAMDSVESATCPSCSKPFLIGADWMAAHGYFEDDEETTATEPSNYSCGGGCAFQTPTGMHTTGDCSCVPLGSISRAERRKLINRIKLLRDRAEAFDKHLDTPEILSAKAFILRTEVGNAKDDDGRVFIPTLVNGYVPAVKVPDGRTVVFAWTDLVVLADLIANRR